MFSTFSKSFNEFKHYQTYCIALCFKLKYIFKNLLIIILTKCQKIKLTVIDSKPKAIQHKKRASNFKFEIKLNCRI